jgi:hypothetical protein
LSVEGLLEMTAQQLADATQQQRRQQQLNSVVMDALRESTQETLEKRRQQMLAGMDPSKSTGGDVGGIGFASAAGSSIASSSSTLLEELQQGQQQQEQQGEGEESYGSSSSGYPPSLSRQGSLDQEGLHLDAAEQGQGSPHGLGRGRSPTSARRSPSAGPGSFFSSSWDEDDRSRDSSTASRPPGPRDIEQRVAASLDLATAAAAAGGGVGGKRPMDVDAMTRMTSSSFKPSKQARTQADVLADQQQDRSFYEYHRPADATLPAAGAGGGSGSSKAKPVSLLGNILSNKAAVAAAASRYNDDEEVVEVEEEEEEANQQQQQQSRSSSSASPLFDAPVKLINSVGFNGISIVRPGGKNIVINGEAWVADTYVNRTLFNVFIVVFWLFPLCFLFFVCEMHIFCYNILVVSANEI